MDYFPLEATMPIDVTVASPTNSQPSAADAPPTLKVYQCGNDTALLSGLAMTAYPSAPESYYYNLILHASSGFARGGRYFYRAAYNVGGVSQIRVGRFAVDYKTVDVDDTGAANFAALLANAGNPSTVTLDSLGSGGPSANAAAIVGLATSSLTGAGTLGKLWADMATAVSAIKAKTDNLPAAPAADGTVTAMGTNVTAIKAKTDNLPAAPAAVSDVPTANANADALLDRVIDTSYSLRKFMRGFASVLLGKKSGSGTGTEVFRDLADTKPAVTATISVAGDRTAVTRDLT